MRFSPKTIAVSAAIAAGAVGGTGVIASCGASNAPASGGCNQNCDLNNQSIVYPDWYKIVMNVDGQPTAGLSCYAGVGWITTSRDQSAASLQLLPSLNAFCATQIGSRYSITGNQDDEPAGPPKGYNGS